jgi:hypothetical protein
MSQGVQSVCFTAAQLGKGSRPTTFQTTRRILSGREKKGPQGAGAQRQELCIASGGNSSKNARDHMFGTETPAHPLARPLSLRHGPT